MVDPVRLDLDKLRLELINYPNKPKALAVADQLAPWVVEKDPNLIVGIGGDRTVLEAVYRYGRQGKDIFGIKTSKQSTGFFLNCTVDQPNFGLTLPLVRRKLPLLRIEVLDWLNSQWEYFALNEVVLMRQLFQQAHFRVKIDGQLLFPEPFRGDGILLATPAGSHAYAQVITGQKGLPLNAQQLKLVWSHIYQPQGWLQKLVPINSKVEFEVVKPGDRPMTCSFDGRKLCEQVVKIAVEISDSYSANLLFTEIDDLAKKMGEGE